MLSSFRNSISGATRRRSARPTRPRRCSAIDARPSNVAARCDSEPSTETKTLAWRRSRDTSTAVTVTSPATRGSLTSFARKVAISSRIAAATRSERWWSGVTMNRSGDDDAQSRRAGLQRASGLLSGLEGARDFLGAEALESVADLDVVEVLDADTALEAFTDFLHIVLEATQRPNGAFVDLDAVADDAQAARAVDDAA